MNYINWEQLYSKYKGQWIALEDDEETLIASGKTMKEALEKARQQGHANPIITYMPPELVSFAGYEV